MSQYMWLPVTLASSLEAARLCNPSGLATVFDSGAAGVFEMWTLSHSGWPEQHVIDVLSAKI